jgi:hypothetical protein
MALRRERRKAKVRESRLPLVLLAWALPVEPLPELPAREPQGPELPSAQRREALLWMKPWNPFRCSVGYALALRSGIKLVGQ